MHTRSKVATNNTGRGNYNRSSSKPADLVFNRWLWELRCERTTRRCRRHSSKSWSIWLNMVSSELRPHLADWMTLNQQWLVILEYLSINRSFQHLMKINRNIREAYKKSIQKLRWVTIPVLLLQLPAHPQSSCPSKYCRILRIPVQARRVTSRPDLPALNWLAGAQAAEAVSS